MSYSAIYTRCFRALMQLEGWDELVNHPNDPGGLTKYGISKLAYPEEDITNLTQDRAMFLYHRDYWTPLMGESLNSEAVAFQLFESAVHMDAPSKPGIPNGPKRAVKIAQGALIIHGINVTFDGIIGPKTVAALNNYRYKDSLVKWMNLLQGAALLVGSTGQDELVGLVKERLKTLQTFSRGWGRRLAI